MFCEKQWLPLKKAVKSGDGMPVSLRNKQPVPGFFMLFAPLSLRGKNVTRNLVKDFSLAFEMTIRAFFTDAL